jgi:hypothetical protein
MNMDVSSREYIQEKDNPTFLKRIYMPKIIHPTHTSHTQPKHSWTKKKKTHTRLTYPRAPSWP